MKTLMLLGTLALTAACREKSSPGSEQQDSSKAEVAAVDCKFSEYLDSNEVNVVAATKEGELHIATLTNYGFEAGWSDDKASFKAVIYQIYRTSSGVVNGRRAAAMAAAKIQAGSNGDFLKVAEWDGVVREKELRTFIGMCTLNGKK